MSVEGHTHTHPDTHRNHTFHTPLPPPASPPPLPSTTPGSHDPPTDTPPGPPLRGLRDRGEGGGGAKSASALIARNPNPGDLDTGSAGSRCAQRRPEGSASDQNGSKGNGRRGRGCGAPDKDNSQVVLRMEHYAICSRPLWGVDRRKQMAGACPFKPGDPKQVTKQRKAKNNRNSIASGNVRHSRRLQSRCKVVLPPSVKERPECPIRTDRSGRDGFFYFITTPH